MKQAFTSLVDILLWRAKIQPGEIAFRFLPDGEFDEMTITYDELDRRARQTATQLQSSVMTGDRVLLLFPPGLDFIVAYLGCLYANVIAVPAYPPHPARIEITLPLTRRIIKDAGAVAVLLNKSLYDALISRPALHAELGYVRLLVPDNDAAHTAAEYWVKPETYSGNIAHLQYTSGSTSLPKGVMVSHNNLMHNLSLIEKCFRITRNDVGIFWLPPYHDMGLIGGILQPIYSGAPFTIMPHLMFLQRPFRWLQAISRYKATISGGPNFAYDLCTKKIKPEQRDQLDLSSWRLAFNGAEPVYHKSLDGFAAYFAPCGFQKSNFLPCYGLAESTLLVTSGLTGTIPTYLHVHNKEMKENRVCISPAPNEFTQTLVSSGFLNNEQHVRIVNPLTCIPTEPGEVGEIWLSGYSSAGGYWDKLSETVTVFKARMAHNPGETFLRTGDLGFIHKGELFVTGRIKDLIIVDGKNHYPQDIEKSVEESHPAIRTGGCAAFSIPCEGQEDVILVVETEHKTIASEVEIISAIRNSVSLIHGLYISDIVLAKPGSIPRTTSGKTKHFLCKQYYAEGRFNEIETT